MEKEQVDDGNGQEPDSQRPPSSTGFTFFQRWFCRPVEVQKPKSELSEHERDAEASQDPQRKFSLLSRGSLIAEALLIVMLLAVVAVALAVTLTAKSDKLPEHVGNHAFPPSDDQPGNLAYALSKPPVRLGIFTNFPDPTIWHDRGKWWALATNDAAGILNRRKGTVDPKEFSRSNIQIASSTDFKRWNLMNSSSDPLPDPGPWVRRADKRENKPDRQHTGKGGGKGKKKPGESVKKLVGLANVWAPDLLQHPKTGQWLLYYAAATPDGPHCIGVGTAFTPQGPFKPGPEPLMCHKDQGGAIDPVAFIDNDEIYLAYKIDGNAVGNGGECGNTKSPIHTTPILLQKMSEDGTEIDPSFGAVQLLDRDKEDGPLVEAPAIVKVGATYFMFYSGGCTRSPSYNVRYATALRLTGPYTRKAGPPLMRTGDHGLLAPGSVSVRWAQAPHTGEVVGPGSQGHWKMAFHARVPTSMGRVRAMFTSALEFNGDRVKLVNDPDNVI
ncbi:MAG: hypothetical protein M1831_005317 [Alyxoria varia]|nr:MAG: hypothetical protein M1831_005317 [Alyxoria varia]